MPRQLCGAEARQWRATRALVDTILALIRIQVHALGQCACGCVGLGRDCGRDSVECLGAAGQSADVDLTFCSHGADCCVCAGVAAQTTIAAVRFRSAGAF